MVPLVRFHNRTVPSVEFIDPEAGPRTPASDDSARPSEITVADETKLPLKLRMSTRHIRQLTLSFEELERIFKERNPGVIPDSFALARLREELSTAVESAGVDGSTKAMVNIYPNTTVDLDTNTSSVQGTRGIVWQETQGREKVNINHGLQPGHHGNLLQTCGEPYST